TGCSDDGASKPKTDTTAPSLSSAAAADRYHVDALFSEALDEESAEAKANYLILEDGTTDTLEVLNAVLLSDEKTVTLETVAQSDVSYALTATAVEDKAGNAMAAQTVTFVGSAALDNNPPTVASTDPYDGEIGVGINETIVVEFSEAMNTVSVESSFEVRADDWGGPEVSGAFDWNAVGSTMMFTPSAPLTNYRAYFARVGTGASDSPGNHLASEYAWSFVTGTGGGISGTVTYSGPLEPNKVNIGVFTAPCFSQSAADAEIGEPGYYEVYPLAPGTYYVGAFMDLDGNDTPDVGEPAGMYDTNGDDVADPVSVQAGDMHGGIDFPLDITIQLSTISGTVSKQPEVVDSDTTYVLCFLQDPTAGEADAILVGLIPSGTGPYTTLDLPMACYYVICFMDTNHNQELDFLGETPSEPVGLYGYVDQYGTPVFTPIFLIEDATGVDMMLFYMTDMGAPLGQARGFPKVVVPASR
ncbi:MAG: Ig-like domain-containing protein, partial [Candidatus Eisenbacteria bacterium]|nr:Ig-like domain-containing protein [Candidatus Eisenbacteria bacterium]